MACYEDLRTLYAATAQERDLLKADNQRLQEAYEHMFFDLQTRTRQVEALNRENFEQSVLIEELKGALN